MLAAPVIGAVASGVIELPVGTALQLPVSATDGDGGRISWSVSAGGVVSAGLRPGTNTFIEMRVADFGSMQFQLFDDATPETVRRIRGLIASGFYEGTDFFGIRNTPTTGWRYLQGGDPQNDGTGGPDFVFEDELQRDLQFTGAGQLAMANEGISDTNGSQFLVTAQPHRLLDFNHTIFGQLVRGGAVLNRILDTAVDADGPDNVAGTADDFRPTRRVTVTSVREVVNTGDAVLQLRAGQATGIRTVTLRATDPQGESSTQSFRVRVIPDTGAASDSPPVLEPIADQITPAGTPISIPLRAFDPEGDPVTYQLFTPDSGSTNGNVAVIDQSNGRVNFTPAPGFSGEFKLTVAVRTLTSGPVPATRGNRSFGGDTESYLSVFDTETFTIAVGERPITGESKFVSAHAGRTLDGAVVATFTDDDATGRPEDFAARIDWGDGTVSDGSIVPLGDARFAVLGSHRLDRAATLPLTVDVTGNKGATLRLKASVVARPLFAFEGTRLRVLGTDAADVIGLAVRAGVLRVNVNSEVIKIDAATVGSVQIEAFDADDTVTGGLGVPAMRVFAGAGDDVVTGSDFGDEIYGEAGNDLLDGTLGNDLLDGGEGDDTLTGGAGRNTLLGGAGNDRLNGSGSRDFLYGQEGDDRLYGNGGDDLLDGGSGVDRLFGGDGNDTLIGGGGNDKLYGNAGDDLLTGNAGTDLLDGGDDSDSRGDLDPNDLLVSIEEG
jgi:cyclophilin family peptidyl-prolyl cis-trans isomerase/Ca2+-binding RTX toxin-like protein